MKSNLYLITLLVVLAVGLALGVFVNKSCSRPPDDRVIIRTDTTFITQVVPGDSVLFPVTVHVPMPVYIDTVIYIYRDIEIDTPAIVAEFFRMKYYSDTSYMAGNFKIVINDSVNYNRILHRELLFQNLRETTIHTTQIVHQELKVPRLGIGIDAVFNTHRYYIGPSVSYRHNNHLWRTGILLAPQYPVSYTLSYHNLIRRNK